MQVLALALLVGHAHAINFNYELADVPNRQYSEVSPDNLAVTGAQWETVPLLADAPTTFQNLPQGCSCLSEQQTAADCTAFVCRETCDLTKGMCDAFCCSDPDCTDAEIARFRSTGQCLPDGNVDRVTKCTDIGTLEKVNQKYNMFTDRDDDPLAGLLCVSVNNDPYDGSFYTPQSNLVGNVAVLSDPKYDQLSFQDAVQEASGSLNQLDFYSNSLRVLAATKLQDGSFENIRGGFLSLPTSGPSGECVDSNYVQFGQFVQANECVRPVSAQACQDPFSALSVQSLTQNLYVGKTPLASTADASGWLPVTVNKATLVDATTGQVLDTAANTTTLWDAQSSTCANALVGATYEVHHDSDGTILQAKVSVTVANLAIAAASSSVLQAFHVQFVNVNATASADAPSMVDRVVSGNPGYIKGLPVQAGNTTQSGSGGTLKTAIEYDQRGLSMMAANGPAGACFSSSSSSSSSMPWWDVLAAQQGPNAVVTPVAFGVDASSSCTVELTYENFVQNMTSWCKAFSASGFFMLPFSHVGVYGNADPLNTWEWVELHQDSAQELVPVRPASNAGQLACEGFVNRLDIEILWTKSGSTSKPQPMILAARTVLGQADWQWRGSPSTQAVERFTLSHSVTFIEHKLSEKDSVDYKPEVGVTLPQLSYDIFYPFDIGSTAAAGGRVTGILLALLFYVVV